MKSLLVQPTSSVKGIITLPGDKSIAHRALIISAITNGTTSVKNFPTNQDCLRTLCALQKLGIKITKVLKPKELSEINPFDAPRAEVRGLLRVDTESGVFFSRPKGRGLKAAECIKIFGRGLGGLKKPHGSLFLGNSGTSFRLLCGLLSGQDFNARLEAGLSLSRRPMRRISLPLRMMGARISAQRLPCRQGRQANRIEEYPPLTIKGGNLKGISYKMPVASAQVKSAIILAGLYAKGVTCVIEAVKTRDHTERMLKLFQADIKIIKNTIKIKGKRELVSPGTIDIPGDISSAAFFIVLAAIIPGSHLVIKNVSLNPLRTGVLRVLKRMCADIKVTRFRQNLARPRQQSWRSAKIWRDLASKTGGAPSSTKYEPAGDITAKNSLLKGTTVRKEEIPSLIDELPILMVAASIASGRTVFQGAGELRVKETDRINSMFKNLESMGARIKIVRRGDSENIIIDGVKELRGSKVKSFGDHRTAMSMIVAGLRAKGNTQIDDTSCISKSFPAFLDKLNSLLR
jgi:3-phosphoshikimate 1-carboxyvinyltransferase